MTSVRLLPLGLVHGGMARAVVKAGQAIPVAGGWCAATQVALHEYPSTSAEAGELLTAQDFIASTDSELTRLRERLTAPRPPVAGINLEQPAVVGILNLTPDSFSDGGAYHSPSAAAENALSMVRAGARCIDIGGESTRPGADTIAAAAEAARVEPVITALCAQRTRHQFAISLDTRKAELMRRAPTWGADVINDVSALSHEAGSMEAARQSGLPIVVMHNRGDPKNMQANAHYEDVVGEVYQYLERRIADCVAAGIERSRLIIDPGIGFGKTAHHNLLLLRQLTTFHGLGTPLLIGASRKRFVGEITGIQDARQRVIGSVAVALDAVAKGAQMVRVHDVAQTAQALTMNAAIWQ